MKMKRNWKKRYLSFGMIGLLSFSILGNGKLVFAEENVIKHGNVSYQITEDMLSNTPPSDYTINGDMQRKAKEGVYNSFFLKEDLQVIEIEIEENNLNYMFQHANEKPSVMTKSVTIGEETIYYAGLKTKGSYTLDHSFTDHPESDRFSLTINFGKYIKKKDYRETQNFYGVSKISLNNFFFDKSMMKEYCALTLMQQMGVPTPQFGLTKLYINGNYYGVYFMVEALDQSILEQYLQCGGSEVGDYLCKPEGTRFLYEELEEDFSPMWEWDEDTYEKVKDELPVVEEWVKRLNLLSEGKDFSGNEIDVNSEAYIKLLEQVMDVDETLRYFAAHSFLCQLDNMFVGQKNFGLYVDEQGKSMMIPWDYDLSFGCYAPGTAEETSNYNIDLMYILEWGEPATKAAFTKFYKNYPLFYVIFQNDSLMEKYHGYMLDCAKIMELGGTTSFGTTYEPASMNQKIETLTEPLKEAAAEEVTERAAYMNGIVQPRDLNAALLNLPKIIASRSLGVYMQVTGINTHVTGRGCNMFTVGNGMDNWWLLDQGYISSIDAATGIFATSKYNVNTPLLVVKEITLEDERYSDIKKAVKAKDGRYFQSYFLADVANTKEPYEVTIPMSAELEKKNLEFYYYEDGNVTRLSMEKNGNLYTTNLDSLGVVVIVEKAGIFSPYVWLVICVVLMILLGILAVSLSRRKKAAVEEKGEVADEGTNDI